MTSAKVVNSEKKEKYLRRFTVEINMPKVDMCDDSIKEWVDQLEGRGFFFMNDLAKIIKQE